MEVFDRLKAALAGTYRIERKLGAGGMATVYLGRDLRHDRDVAIKVLLPDVARALSPERFLQEIHIAAQLQHPLILPLFDSGRPTGSTTSSCPASSGSRSDNGWLREKRIPLDEAVRIGREVAEALEYAHGKSVIHRDIKPENIMLSGGHPLVADFGIARALGSSDDPRMTSTGLRFGTPLYMSPEQALGDPDLDHRSDIYSLGCVIYEMISGTTPHTGASLHAILSGHVGGIPTRTNVRQGGDSGRALVHDRDCPGQGARRIVSRPPRNSHARWRTPIGPVVVGGGVGGARWGPPRSRCWPVRRSRPAPGLRGHSGAAARRWMPISSPSRRSTSWARASSSGAKA